MKYVARLWILFALPCGLVSAAALRAPDFRASTSCAAQCNKGVSRWEQEDKSTLSIEETARRNAWEFSKSASVWLPIGFTARTESELGVFTKRLGLREMVSGSRGGFMLRWNARKGRLGFVANFSSGEIHGTNHISYSAKYGSVNLPTLDLDSIKCSTADVEASWRLGSRNVTFDVLAGLRLVQAQSCFTANPGYIECNKEFLEPLTGGVLSLSVSESWILSARVCVSGFSLGSKLTTDIEPRLSYWFSKNREAFVGYRLLSTEYQQPASGFVQSGLWRVPFPQVVYEGFHVGVDCTVHGPIVGFSLRW